VYSGGHLKLKLTMSVDIAEVFTALRKALETIDVYAREQIPRRLIEEMGLKDRDEYLALKAYGFIVNEGLDVEEAYEILGKECVDEWVSMGTFADSSDPIAFENLDHWCDPDSRKKYYEEHLAKHTTLRRTGSMCVKVHPNFTIAEIEHAMRNK
jgi:hypothetical protein